MIASSLICSRIIVAPRNDKEQIASSLIRSRIIVAPRNDKEQIASSVVSGDFLAMTLKN